jgi:glutathione S-transferase
MYQLLTFPAGFGEFSYSPFCIKAAWLLNYAGVAWAREDLGDPRKMPHAKLPVLRDGDRLIHDSGAITTYLAARGADFWTGASPRERAFGAGLISMAEDRMGFFLALDRWENEDVWPYLRTECFAEVPAILRGFVAGKVRKTLLRGIKTQGAGRLTLDERMAVVEADLQVITTLLEDGPFLLGTNMTLPDFSVAAMLTAMAAAPVPTPQADRIRGDAVLMGYIERVKALVDSVPPVVAKAA